MAILQLRGAALRAKPSISVPLKSTASALAGILLIPLLLPALPFVLFSVSSFGGVTASVSGQSSYTLSLFNVANVTQYAWALWICFVLFIIQRFTLRFVRRPATCMTRIMRSGRTHGRLLSP